MAWGDPPPPPRGRFDRQKWPSGYQGGTAPFVEDLHNAPAGPNGTTSMLMAYAGALQSVGCSMGLLHWRYSTSLCHVHPRRHFLAHERGINMGCGTCKMDNLSCPHVPGAPCDALHHAGQAM